ncbi:phage holin family protein [Aerococcaceae bacterium NML191292]|nr:phage holin family protein [Aerococcaceae bacterium NML191292]MCW6674360.1 phage holin family protein [Aerococcaceae bacterium NML171108]MCW6681921.1 phage holin family protein [Aerococcaceae bacterium NML160702]MDO4774261.1 phage holin family protein [Aerococcaceae bacterium]
MKKIIINAFLFLVLAYFIPGVVVNSIWSALFAAIIYALLSGIVQPILQVIALPINFLSLGLINFLISGLILYMTSGLSSGMHINSFWTALFMSAILAILQSTFMPAKKRYRD